jgi:hypothetical protein
VVAERVAVFLMDGPRGVLWTSFAHPATGHVRQIRCGAQRRQGARRAAGGAGQRLPHAPAPAPPARLTRVPPLPPAPRARSTKQRDGAIGRCASTKQQISLDFRDCGGPRDDAALTQLVAALEGGRWAAAEVAGSAARACCTRGCCEPAHCWQLDVPRSPPGAALAPHPPCCGPRPRRLTCALLQPVLDPVSDAVIAVLVALNKVEDEVADGAFDEAVFSRSDRWAVDGRERARGVALRCACRPKAACLCAAPRGRPRRHPSLTPKPVLAVPRPRDALGVLSMEVADALSARALEVSFASAMSVVAANGASTHNLHLAHMMRAQLLDYYGGWASRGGGV